MSPYEIRLQQEKVHRVGLIALVRPGSEDALAAAAKKAPARLSLSAMTNVEVTTRAIGKRIYAFTYLEYRGPDLEAVPALLRTDSWFNSLAPHLEPHPRATAAGTPWLRMELVNIIGPTVPEPAKGKPATRTGLVAGLKPESELWYRTLHQTNWPGVVDQMARSHFRYWVTFLIEFDAELLLFTYCEYTGTDKAADDAAMAADPVNQRWWKHTEPCLIPQMTGGGNWTPLATLASIR